MANLLSDITRNVSNLRLPLPLIEIIKYIYLEEIDILPLQEKWTHTFSRWTECVYWNKALFETCQPHIFCKGNIVLLHKNKGCCDITANGKGSWLWFFLMVRLFVFLDTSFTIELCLTYYFISIHLSDQIGSFICAWKEFIKDSEIVVLMISFFLKSKRW